MSIVITVVCEGLDHRLEFRDDGEIVMLDHSEKLVRSFVAFGAKPPECMEEIDEAREFPVNYLLDHLKADRKTIILLACDFAEQVLPIWYEYYKDDERPEKAIQTVRKYVAGNIKLSMLNRARSAADAARASASAAWTAAAALSAGAVETSAADAALSAADAAKFAAWAARAASGAERSAHAAWAARVAAWAAYHHARDHGNDPDAAASAEKKWQVSRMVQVLEAISRGEDPWRS
jgi:hypothetical protein